MEEKKDYLRILKHDIKGPLTVIKGYLSFWESDAYTKFPPEKQKEFILKAMNGAKKIICGSADEVATRTAPIHQAVARVSMKNIPLTMLLLLSR